MALERALSIDERVYGPDHPRVAAVVNKLGKLLRELGDLTRARAAYERALQLASKEGWVVVSMKNDWTTVFA